MFYFGRFTVSLEPKVINDVTYQNGVFLRNEHGQSLADLFEENPHPFYIAIDDMGRVVAMESDEEKIKIPKHQIIGIDSDFGFTHGENSTAFGKIWNGEAIVVPPASIPALTSRQFWQAALVLGVTEEGLLTSISNSDDPLYIEDEGERLEVSIDIRKATSFRRDYPLIDDMAAAYNIPQEQMDALWQWAAQIE